jgi:hypothetical protein
MPSASSGEQKPEDDPVIQKMAKLVQELESERKSTIVPILFTDVATIDADSVSDVYEFLEHEKELRDLDVFELILHSEGGDLDAALHLSRILRTYVKPSGQIKVIVPRLAKSAATLVACCGDTLVMDKPSELGPLDPIWMTRLGDEYYSPLAIPKTIEFLNDMENALPKKSRIIEIIAKNLSVERMGLFKASLDDAIPPTVELLSTRMFKNDPDGAEKAKHVAQRFAQGYPEHGYPIGLKEALELGLKVETASREQWKKIWQIWRMFEVNYL